MKTYNGFTVKELMLIDTNYFNREDDMREKLQRITYDRILKKSPKFMDRLMYAIENSSQLRDYVENLDTPRPMKPKRT